MADSRVQTYKDFLRSPQASQLAADASLTYITSCQSFKGVEAILANAILNSRHVKKSENIISQHVAVDSLVLESVTTIEFVNGTGSYVPGLDKNFVVDHTVVLPIIHSVIFQDDKIKSVRLFWDQGSMLKQLGIIGNRGNVWPIFPGRDQEKLMLADAVPSGTAVPVPDKTENFGRREHFEISQLEQEDEVVLPRPAAIAHAVSAKPQPRSFQDMVDSEQPVPPSPMRLGRARETYNIFDEDSQAPMRQTKGPAPETPEQVRAKRDFTAKNYEPHFQFGGTPDAKPLPYSKTRANMHPQPDEPSWDYGNEAQERVTGAGRPGMISDLQFTDYSPAPAQKFNGIKIAGNGMGGRGAQRSLWGGSEDEVAEQRTSARVPAPAPGATNAATNAAANSRRELAGSYRPTPLSEQHNFANDANESTANAVQDDQARFQGIKIAGNGMGSRGKPQWTLNMEPDEREQPEKKVEPPANKYQGRLISHRQFQSSWSFGNDEEDKEN